MKLVNQRTGRVYELHDETVIGRDRDCLVCVPDGKASRRHARVHQKDGKWFVEDLGSKNGTFVDGVRLSRPQEMAPGSAIKIGATVLLLASDGRQTATGRQPPDILWSAATTVTQATVDPTRYDLAKEAAGVSNRRESTRLQSRLAVIEKVNRALRDLTQTEQIEDAATAELLDVFPPARRCLILRRDAQSGRLALRAGRYRPDSGTVKDGISRSLVEGALETGAAVMANHSSEEPPRQDDDRGCGAFLCAPLRVRGKVETVIYLDAAGEPKGTPSRTDRFAEDDLTLLALLAQQISLFMEKASLLEELRRDKLALKEETDRLRRKQECDFGRIVGSSRALQAAKERARKAAAADSTVLLTGPRGTGKELFAAAIHYGSARAGKAFVTVNCAAIPEHLVESELFGYLKGAFSGAAADKKGQFEAAEGGTILLDEIGDMPLEAQANILRVLENREVRRIGATETIKVDVRVIASTNKDLQEEIRAGRFRADLFDRLNVFPIELPLLRERKDDILPLLNHYLGIYCTEMNKKIVGFSSEAAQILRHYAWPGNVRELRNTVERIVLELGPKEIVEAADLPPHIRKVMVNTNKYKREGSLHEAVAGLQKDMISDALARCRNNKSEAASLLRVSRAGLEKMMKRLGLT